MVKKSASDVSISGTHGQYSVLPTAKLLPGAPQQVVSRSACGSQGSGDRSDPRGWPVVRPQPLLSPSSLPFSTYIDFYL